MRSHLESERRKDTVGAVCFCSGVFVGGGGGGTGVREADAFRKEDTHHLPARMSSASLAPSSLQVNPADRQPPS